MPHILMCIIQQGQLTPIQALGALRAQNKRQKLMFQITSLSSLTLLTNADLAGRAQAREGQTLPQSIFNLNGFVVVKDLQVTLIAHCQ